MRNKLIDLYLTSIAIFMMGSLEIFFNYNKSNTIKGLYSGIIMILTGVAFLVFTIASHVKYNTKRNQMEEELSKEYDERDELIDGKVSHFTIRVLMIVIVFMMFLSKFIVIPTTNALLIIIISYMVINVLVKKYYYYYF